MSDKNKLLIILLAIAALFLWTEFGKHGETWETSIKNMKTTNTVRISD